MKALRSRVSNVSRELREARARLAELESEGAKPLC